jgi:hypothetical protein
MEKILLILNNMLPSKVEKMIVERMRIRTRVLVRPEWTLCSNEMDSLRNTPGMEELCGFFRVRTKQRIFFFGSKWRKS